MVRSFDKRPDDVWKLLKFWQVKVVSLLLAILFVPPATVLLILAAIKLWDMLWPVVLVAFVLLIVVLARRFLAGQSWRWR